MCEFFSASTLLSFFFLNLRSLHGSLHDRVGRPSIFYQIPVLIIVSSTTCRNGTLSKRILHKRAQEMRGIEPQSLSGVGYQ
jgi:hypothetical protein